jgi:protoporphyrinogen oxidase
MSSQSRIGIIGAGPAGLSAAFDLAQTGARVTVLEAATEVGGLASGFKAAHWNWSLEKFYHHWFQTDKAIIQLARELGVERKILWPRPYTAVYINGRFQPLDSPLEALRLFLSNFSLVDMIKFGVATAHLRFSNNWKPLEKVTAAAWARKWYGDRFYQAFFEPMLIGKFGEENLGVVNMAWLWARLHARTTRLGTFEGGFQAFMDTLADACRARGVEIKLATPVHLLRQNPGGWTVETGAGPMTFDRVLATTSPQAFIKLVPELPELFTAKLKALKSMGAVVMVLSVKHKLSKYYWHNLPKVAGYPFLALVEHTNYIDAKHYGGDHILYCGDYLPPDHEYFALDKWELLERFLPGIKKFNPEFDRTWINDLWVWKAPYAQPIPGLNHSAAIPNVKTPLPGLYFASMSHIYPWDRGTNYAVEMGRKVAKELS